MPHLQAAEKPITPHLSRSVRAGSGAFAWREVLPRCRRARRATAVVQVPCGPGSPIHATLTGLAVRLALLLALLQLQLRARTGELARPQRGAHTQQCLLATERGVCGRGLSPVGRAQRRGEASWNCWNRGSQHCNARTAHLCSCFGHLAYCSPCSHAAWLSTLNPELVSSTEPAQKPPHA